MNSAIQDFSSFWASEFPAGWADVWLKSVLVLLLATGLRLGWRRASAATRHGMSLTTLISLPFLPLVEIARSFRHSPKGAGIAMARSTGLQQRVGAIPDARPSRNRIGKRAIGLSILPALGVAFLTAGISGENRAGGWSLDRSPAAVQLNRFVAEKKAQAEAGCRAEGKEYLPGYARIFAAAEKGDWLTISNAFEDLRQRAPQYERRAGATNDVRLHGIAWETVKEIWGAFYAFNVSGEKYSLAWSDGIIHSIPPGSVYFGGTDPGRFLITAMAKSQIHGDPFFILTQNAMADNSYLDYLRSMYNGRIYIPTKEDSQRCFDEYVSDASARLAHDEAFPREAREVRPGENLNRGSDGKVEVSGQVAVMSINGLLTRIIFEKVPDREFYVEESFPLDWMYPRLEPHGLIMKINREEMKELPTDVVRADHAYWTTFVKGALGDGFSQEATVHQIGEFANKVYVRHDLRGFRGDAEFVENKDPQKMFSKLRVSQAGVYAWRVERANGEADKRRMAQEADFAFRQAWALCPDAPESVFRYVTFLIGQKRAPDALVVAETALALDPQNASIDALVRQLKQMPAGR